MSNIKGTACWEGLDYLGCKRGSSVAFFFLSLIAFYVTMYGGLLATP